MTHLDKAIFLYRDDRLKKLEIDYTLADDKQEKQALKIAILNLKEKQG